MGVLGEPANRVRPQLFFVYFILCPPSGDGRVFKPCHRPGEAESLVSSCSVWSDCVESFIY